VPNSNLQLILEQEGIQEFKDDIRTFSKKKLLKSFSASSSGKAKATFIIKNQIWQTFLWIQSGKHPLIEGNLRSYWYSHLKPTLARVDLLSAHDHYQTMLEIFVELVKTHKLFRYSDFGFDDENWENRRIATKLFNVILFAEKAGWFRTLKEFYEEHGMNIVVLGGTPSLLSTEYFVKHLSQVTSLDQKFYLISAVDYDPAGAIIANAFMEQLQSQGIHELEVIPAVSLEHYTPKEIDLFKFPLPEKQATKTKKWMQATNGIHGKPFGLEADSLPRERYKQIVKDKLKSITERR
jgi:hypothetical protein